MGQGTHARILTPPVLVVVKVATSASRRSTRASVDAIAASCAECEVTSAAVAACEAATLRSKSIMASSEDEGADIVVGVSGGNCSGESAGGAESELWGRERRLYGPPLIITG